MNEYMQPFGSGDLSSARIRSMRFPTQGGGYDPAAVHEFLEQVASAVEVLTASDIAQGMRRELERSSEISSRMVLAGQEAAERLRQQAADDARTILEDTKQLAEKLRDAARDEVERTRAHVEEMRRTFTEELRDLYDRIGATLYRFENVQRVESTEMAAEVSWPEVGGVEHAVAAPAVNAVASAPADVSPAPSAPAGASAEHTDASLAPAWTQLDPAAYVPPAGMTPAPAEPLVDLTAFHEPEGDASDTMGGWLVDDDADTAPAAEVSAGAGSFELPPVPETTDDNARAEALLANVGDVLAAAAPPEPQPLPSPPLLDQPAAGGPDPMALQQFVLQSLHEGMDRSVIETWLADRYGIANPQAVVDAALQAQSQGGAGA